MEHLYLAHHGIKGMKWGVRRFQNPDGTLTEAGKRRYLGDGGRLTSKGKKAFTDPNGRLNDAGIKYYNSQGYSIKDIGSNGSYAYSKVSGEGYFSPTLKATGKDVEAAVENMRNSANELVSGQAEALDNVNRAVSEVSHSKDARQTALETLDREFGGRNNVDDDEYLYIITHSVAWSVMCEYGPKTAPGQKVNEYDASVNKWFDDAKTKTNQLMAGKEDIILGSDKQNREYTYKDVVYSTLVDSAPIYFSHMAREGSWWLGLDNSKELDSFVQSLMDEYKRG